MSFDEATGDEPEKSQGYTIRQISNHSEPGDILEFQFNHYTHYALHLGDGRVINVDVENERATEATIREHTLQEVCPVGKVRMRNHEDVAQMHFQVSARPAKEVVEIAKTYQDRVVPYEYDFRNSEYYCTLWRYGKGFSMHAVSHGSVGEDYAKYKKLAVHEQGTRSDGQSEETEEFLSASDE